MYRMIAILLLAGLTPLAAQETASPPPDPFNLKTFIMKNHLHQISGGTTIALAALTGAAGVSMALGADVDKVRPYHQALAYGTVGAGALTLSLGLTAFNDQLDRVWPHVLFMGLAETGFALNAFVLQPGSLPHRITGAASITSLGLGLAAIILIQNEKQ